nr:hypothetical protein [Tanacetum cinerariifolium]
MIVVLEKSEHNIDFHQIVDFVEASHIRYALTINPTVYVSHIRQFWSTARIETTNEGTKILATVDEIPTLRQYSRRATRIAQSKALPTAADEPVSLLRDDSQGEAFPTVSSLEAEQDKENIIKTFALPHDSTPRVTSLDVDEGSMQQQLQELTDLCTSLQRQQTKMATKIKAQDLEISSLKARIKLLEDKDKGNAINILTSGVQAVSVPFVAEVSTVGVPTGSGLVPTISAIFTTASVVTPYSRRSREISAKEKGKEKMVESDTPKKKRLQEQIDVQVAREMEEEMAREDQRMDEQIARDAEIARIHAKEELKMMIDGLDRSNEVIAKHLQEYEQSEAELTIGEKIELINELQIEDFVPMASKEEGERVKRKGLKLEQGSTKRMKTSEDVSVEDIKEKMQLVPMEEIIRLGGHTSVYQFFVDMLKQIDKEDLNQLWALVKETLNIKQASSDKEKELWVELKRMFEPDFEDQLWTHTQALMHDPLEWRLYDTCGVHHVFTKDQEIFMLVDGTTH